MYSVVHAFEGIYDFIPGAWSRKVLEEKHACPKESYLAKTSNENSDLSLRFPITH